MLLELKKPTQFILSNLTPVPLPKGTEVQLFAPGTNMAMISPGLQGGTHYRAEIIWLPGGSANSSPRLAHVGAIGHISRDVLPDWPDLLTGRSEHLDALAIPLQFHQAFAEVIRKMEACSFLAASSEERCDFFYRLLHCLNLGENKPDFDAFETFIGQMTTSIQRKYNFLISARSLVFNRSLFVPWRVSFGYTEDTSLQCLAVSDHPKDFYHCKILDVGCGLSFFAAEMISLFQSQCICLDLEAKVEGKLALVRPYILGICFQYLLFETGRSQSLYLGTSAEEHRIQVFSLFQELELVCSTYLKVPIKQGSILDLPYQDNTFDTVVCVWVLPYLDPEQQVVALSEMLRVANTCVTIKIQETPLLSGGGCVQLDASVIDQLCLKKKKSGKGIVKVTYETCGLQDSVWIFRMHH